jgi:sugar phosphate isomerase/epimerase
MIFPVLRKAGFSHLEVMDRGDVDPKHSVLEDIVAESQANDIKIPNWHLVMESPFKKNGETREATISHIKNSMDKGKIIGAKNHILHWHQRFKGQEYDTLWKNFIDDLVHHAEHLGIRLLMETVPDKPKNERYVSTSEIAEFVRNYPPEVLSVCVDVNHSNLKEYLPDVVHGVKDRLVSIHVSDNDGKAEKHWLPGQGVIDFYKLFECLDSIEFNGLIVLEVVPWCETPQKLSAVKRLYEFGKTLIDTKRPHPETPILANT